MCFLWYALIIILQELYGNANQDPNKSYTTDSSRTHSAHYIFSYFYIDNFMCGIQFLLYKVSKVYFCNCELAALIYMLQEITMRGIEPGYIHESCRAAVKMAIA